MTSSTTRTACTAILLVSAVASGCADPDTSPTLVVRGATIIDGTGGEAVPNGELVVVDGRIRCAGARDACEAPAGADEIDGAGFHVIPGLIDVRSHPRWDARPDGTERRERLRFLLGVTTTRSADALDARWVPTTASPRDPVPRLLLGEQPGGATTTLPASVDRFPESDSDAAATELEAEARRLAAEGVRLEPRLATLEVAIAPYGLPPGLHRLGELSFVLGAIRDTRAVTDAGGNPAVAAGKLAAARRFVRTFHEAGGVVVTGSDDILPPGLSIQEEMKALVRAGLTPGAAIAAATRDAAAAIGAADSLGTLEPGKLADFVVLEGDPLADIANVELVSRVAKAGVLHDPAHILDALGDDLRDRTTAPFLRLTLGLVASLLALTATAIAIRRHANDRRHEGMRR